MRRALDLAWRGWGRVHPNPMVGAVVLGPGSDDGIVGEGFHAEFGRSHAEPTALEAAGERARGGTLVVTLEPCAHVGKQPPCIAAVARSGVRRVVAAMPDLNPVAAGGAEWLRGQGIEVDIGLLREDAERQNAVFLHSTQGKERPFVAVKLATSLDYRIADRSGHSRWISGEEARDFVHWLRAGFGAIGVGGRTASTDDPALTVRGPVEPRVVPKRVIFVGGRRLPLELELVRTAREVPTIVVSGQLGDHDASALTERGVTLVRWSLLEDGMAELWQLGIESILIEGGGRLTGGLLSAGLVDRFYWLVSPVWLGETGVPAVRGFEVPSLVEAERWRLVERRALGQDTLLVFDRR
ncbi:MAG: bifunctional diaminohydroxyphosphoribosylaminopyrimidine deaminase/5-amino-6-(5-phosphoribosylamino)uracil reductase RibD [Gemmatimonadota bacterium]